MPALVGAASLISDDALNAAAGVSAGVEARTAAFHVAARGAGTSNVVLCRLRYRLATLAGSGPPVPDRPPPAEDGPAATTAANDTASQNSGT